MSSDLEIKRYGKNSIPVHTSEDIIERTIPKMLEDPNNNNIASKYLGEGKVNNEDFRLYDGEDIFGLVGTWDTDRGRISKVNRIMPEQPLDSIYSIIGVCSLISPEEHPSQFDKGDTNEQKNEKSKNYAKSVIDNSHTSIKIENSKGNRWEIDQNSLDRISFKSKDYRVHKNCWTNVNLPRNEQGIATIHGAFDSYCVFLSFTEPDTYKLTINNESPLFDAPTGKKFEMDVKYTITAI